MKQNRPTRRHGGWGGFVVDGVTTIHRMGDKSDLPSYTTSLGVAMLYAAAMTATGIYEGLPSPSTPIAAVMLAAVCFSVSAAVKAAQR